MWQTIATLLLWTIAAVALLVAWIGVLFLSTRVVTYAFFSGKEIFYNHLFKEHLHGEDEESERARQESEIYRVAEGGDPR